MNIQNKLRRRTRVSFIISLILHLVGAVIMNARVPRWYRPPPIAELIAVTPIEIVRIQRFHKSSARKALVAPALQSQTPRRPPVNLVRMALQAPTDSAKKMARPLPLMTQMLGTDVKLAASDSLFASYVTDEALLQDSMGAPMGMSTQSLQTHKVEIKRGFPRKQEPRHEPTPKNEPPITREEQIGVALEGIAESVANGTSASPVDIVFLLDSSGSMENNIRAVGKQLSRMVDVLKEKRLDFTLGVITFKFLNRDTIVFPQTREYEKYQHLLESHVIRRGGDERAYDAIVKSIKRVKFRSGAERRFILVTDEPSKGSYPLTEVLHKCRAARIKLDVIGTNETLDKALAVQTGGLWFPIPGGG